MVFFFLFLFVLFVFVFAFPDSQAFAVLANVRMFANDRFVDRCLFCFLQLPLERRKILIKQFPCVSLILCVYLFGKTKYPLLEIVVLPHLPQWYHH